ncbi:MAG: phenylalanine--tRNA ligase subunit beta [candidate division KSB1 bacterium]|nr:phenylalanine--tRNA ligase subunit beta [candidate division KSB1 bacterium]
MKTTYNWLREYVDLQATPQEVAERLTMLGLEVESLEKVSPRFQGVVVSRILSVQPLEGSDHLHVVEVDAGEPHGALTVVCGAPNVRRGAWAAVAPPGAVLADGTMVTTRQFGSVLSQGMLCSELELGLTSRGEGIWLLEEDQSFRPGQDVADLVGDDWVFEINVTPNRPDCLGTIGIARELSASFRIPLRVPDPRPREQAEDVSKWIRVEVRATEACPRYTARYLWDVQIGPSPFWLARRLELVGMRSINNVVDVTNYVMLEYGQPLHAFDYDLLEGGTIVVQFAQDGQEFVTLDGKLHRLFSDTLLICDAAKPVAIAGVMGGENSEVTATTRRILLESAYFAPEGIRRTRRRLGISTESSFRFERGVDPQGVAAAANRACELMLQMAGGKLARGWVDVYPHPIQPSQVPLRPSRVNEVLGTNIPSAEMVEILQRLGLELRQQGTHYLATVPTFRPDLTREIDLIEEVARHHGYEKIGADVISSVDQAIAGQGRDRLLGKARDLLEGFGFYEAVNLSLISQREARCFVRTSDHLARVVNPLGEEFAWLRPSLLPGLLASTVRNLNHRQRRVLLFEWGKVFGRDPQGAYWERVALAGTMCGVFVQKTWRTPERLVDFYDLKGAVEELLRAITGYEQIEFQSSDQPWLDNGGFALSAAGTLVGFAGRVARSVLEVFECEQDVYAFELDWELIRGLAKSVRTYVPVPRFPPVQQDLALLADESLTVGAVESVIRKHGGPYLRQVSLFDVYRGHQVPQGKKSLAFSLVFQADERTLTEEEVRQQVARILEELDRELGVVLRPR